MPDSPTMRTIMAFDWGLKQLGVAVGNDFTASPQPLQTLKARDGVPDWTAIETLINTWQPAVLVVGEPLNMDGTPTHLHARVKKFAQRLHGRFGLPVDLMDERLSSVAAKDILASQGHRGDYKKVPPDAVAASLILESWFSTQVDKV